MSNVLSLDVLHRRLGHPSSRVMSQVQKSCNSNISINEKQSLCDACQFGKVHALPYYSSSSIASLPLKLIHTNIWDHKDEAIEKFDLYKNEVENQLNKKIKVLRRDQGDEYESPYFDFCAQYGIIYETTKPYSPQSKGVAE